MNKLLSVARIAKETPKSFTLDINQKFIEEVGEGVLKLYPRNVFDGLEVIPRPISAPFLPKFVEEDFKDVIFYDLLPQPGTSDKIEKFISKHKKYRVLGFTACNIVALDPCYFQPTRMQIIGYGEERHAAVSLLEILRLYGESLVKECAVLEGAGEIAHSFGIQHHENCLMNHDPKKRITERKNYFCQECIKKFETGNYAIERYIPPNEFML
jgi:predicted Zn-dependent protease